MGAASCVSTGEGSRQARLGGLRDVRPGWVGCGSLLVVVVGESCVEWRGMVGDIRGVYGGVECGRHAKRSSDWK